MSSSPVRKRCWATRVPEARSCGVRKECSHGEKEKNSSDAGVSDGEEAELLPDGGAGRNRRGIFHAVYLPALPLHRPEFSTRRREGQADRGGGAELFTEAGDREPAEPDAHRRDCAAAAWID